MFVWSFYFITTIYSQKVEKIVQRNPSPILLMVTCYYRIISKSGHQHCVYDPWLFITCTGLCNFHCNQDAELFHHHKYLVWATLLESLPPIRRMSYKQNHMPECIFNSAAELKKMSMRQEMREPSIHQKLAISLQLFSLSISAFSLILEKYTISPLLLTHINIYISRNCLGSRKGKGTFSYN